MAKRTPKRNLSLPLVDADTCACCGTPLPSGQGYDVPHIGAVGPVCATKFGALGELITWVNGRNVTDVSSQEAWRVGSRLIYTLKNIGFKVQVIDGVLQVGKLERKKKDAAKSYKRRRAELIRDLQLAQTLFDEKGEQLPLQGVA
ncbi:hypothetical protein GO986_18830 [Deinococcus sp. HMF7620]|uniref:Uncharacterized protein n=1 Tax=Deinococcus arboris TaxID=2682977 RepID=A0A7C9LN92_9DEIO|nr:hypothetical protein [Deinococcus arboris]MVN88798.1 hypothetical protein [Deinococcus arboris]